MLVTTRWSHHPGKRHERTAPRVALNWQMLICAREDISRGDRGVPRHLGAAVPGQRPLDGGREAVDGGDDSLADGEGGVLELLQP